MKIAVDHVDKLSVLQQWQAIIGTPFSGRRGRPRPMVDPSCITPLEIAEIKTIVRGDVPPHSIRQVVLSAVLSCTPLE